MLNVNSEQALSSNPGSGCQFDEAHPPTHLKNISARESGWSQDHPNSNNLVAFHFLACVSQPVGAETTVEIDIAGEIYSASELMIILGEDNEWVNVEFQSLELSSNVFKGKYLSEGGFWRCSWQIFSEARFWRDGEEKVKIETV